MIRNRALAQTSLGLAVALFVALGAWAQAPRQVSQPARQEVPDNLAPHTAPPQPIPFSHKLHMSKGLKCQTCHTNADPGNMMTIPTASTCMTCHAFVATDKPAIQKLASYAKSNQPIPWVRVYEITPGVTWTHRAHLKSGLQCINCHGDVGQLDAMTKLTSVTSMGTCIGCHEMHKAPTVCITCHTWPSNVPSAVAVNQ